MLWHVECVQAPCVPWGQKSVQSHVEGMWWPCLEWDAVGFTVAPGPAWISPHLTLSQRDVEGHGDRICRHKGGPGGRGVYSGMGTA